MRDEPSIGLRCSSARSSDTIKGVRSDSCVQLCATFLPKFGERHHWEEREVITRFTSANLQRDHSRIPNWCLCHNFHHLNIFHFRWWFEDGWWLSWLEQRWRWQRNAIGIVSCMMRWTTSNLEAYYYSFGLILMLCFLSVFIVLSVACVCVCVAQVVCLMILSFRVSVFSWFLVSSFLLL